ncbi:MAG: cysteine--tRNA ligase, partial [Firmicutes bacterium]|nr:cysteine--tRNA ligase [Bacillota bacterium]
NYIQNFTDVDDKIINKANDEGVSTEEIVTRYIAECFTDADGLNVRRATHHPRVTQEMSEIIDMIKVLIEKGHAYENEGTVYFDVASFPEYGKLSGKNIDDLLAGASERVTEDASKKSFADFVLWKPKKEGEPGWDSPWGEGRPGWHIECSVMAKKYLGNSIDIHAGGEDLVFPHHENEIAQSEAANGVIFSKYWLHNGFITVDNEKMAKSAGNFFTVREISEKFPYEVIRFFVLNGHYRSPLNFSEELMQACQNGLMRIKNCKKDANYYISAASEQNIKASEDISAFEKFRKDFERAMDDDFNTADAVTAIYELVRAINLAIREEASAEYVKAGTALLDELCGILGISADENKTESSDDAVIEELIAARTAAKAQKDYKTADEIRDRLNAMGITVKDTKQGVQWFRN